MNRINEKAYFDLLLRTIKYSDYEQKEEILNLLKHAYITFDKTSSFTRKSWQWYENVEIRIPPEYKSSLEKYAKALQNWCSEIYEETEDYDFGGSYIKIGTRQNADIINQDIFFEGLQTQIIEKIRAAKYIIWIAVAWFTDPVLYKELIRKKNEGLNIQIIIVNDLINQNGGLPFENDFETYRIKPEGYFENIVHHKFCVIDFETSIHGSYNWTKKAQYNKETLSIDVNKETAEKFAQEFLRIKRKEIN